VAFASGENIYTHRHRIDGDCKDFTNHNTVNQSIYINTHAFEGFINMSRLFQPLTVGPTKLEHRVAMAPLTRYRWDDDWTASSMKDMIIGTASPTYLLPDPIINATSLTHTPQNTTNSEPASPAPSSSAKRP
jgi:hypothetical protein